jgi:hypothetical protein
VNIGLYGDSFTGNVNRPAHQYHWSVLLGKELNVTINNYGRKGSPIYYSYKKFIETYKDNDLHIFLVTEPGRYIKEIQFNKNVSEFVPNFESVENYLKSFKQDNLSHDMDERTLRDLKGWFISSCDEYNLTVAELMIEKIRNLDNNTIFVPSFTRGLSHSMRTEQKTYENSLFKIHNFQSDCLGIPKRTWHNESQALISGHFTPEVNELFFRIILKRVQTGIWDWTLPEKIEFKHKSTEYYTKKYIF